MQHHSVGYTFAFSAAVCGVCAIFVSSLAVGLGERQEANKLRFKQQNVLEAAGFVAPGEKIGDEEMQRYLERIQTVLVDLTTGEEVEGDAIAFDQQAAKKDPARSREAPDNPSRVSRFPHQAQVFKVLAEDGSVEKLVLPIEGYGLWGTLYGFLALSADTRTISGITYYEHKETPGLGGEVDNPRWKARWTGRRAFDDSWAAKVTVIKGAAGPPSDDPHRVDGLSGATITSRGVTNMLHLWLGPEGFGPYLEKIRAAQGVA